MVLFINMLRCTLRRFSSNSNSLKNAGASLASQTCNLAKDTLTSISSSSTTSSETEIQADGNNSNIDTTINNSNNNNNNNNNNDITGDSSDNGKMSITIRSSGIRRPLKVHSTIAEPVKRIMLVRCGTSLANVDINTYVTTPDWRIPIVPQGEEESYRAGRSVAEIVGDEPVYYYFSPYLRCRQSFRHMLRGYDEYRSDHNMGGDRIIGVREDVRLRDGDIGRYDSKDEILHHLREREIYGKFYYRFPHGESGADVCDRVTSFLDAFQRERLDFPMDTNVVIMTHGQTIRMFVKRWFHLTVDTYHLMVSPPAGSISTLTRMHHRSCFRLDDHCVEAMQLPLSLNEFNGYKYRNKQLLGSMSTGAPFM